MTFIDTVDPDEATGATAHMYATDQEAFGYLPNFTRAFSHRPAVYAAWRQLNAAIKSDMDPRRYELATIAAARRLRSSYCVLAHGSILLDNFLDAGSVTAVASGHGHAGLSDADVAVMDLAEKVADDATSIQETDLESLRSVGLRDEEIADVVLTAAVRCFFSKTLDALGVEPDAKYNDLETGVRDALTVGRPIASS
jgi:uncharacterized peroxidase-related enzyme